MRIPTSTFERLQALAVPLVDTLGSVVEKLLDFYDNHQGEAELKEVVRSSKISKNSHIHERGPRQRGGKIIIDRQTYEGSVSEVYEKVLKHMFDHGYLTKLKSYLPLKTSSKRYLISNSPVHPNGNEFVVPVSYRGYYLEAHKSWENAVNCLQKLSDLSGFSFSYIE